MHICSYVVNITGFLRWLVCIMCAILSSMYFTDMIFHFKLYTTIDSYVSINNKTSSWQWSNPLQVVSYSADATNFEIILSSYKDYDTLAFLVSFGASFATNTSWACDNFGAVAFDTVMVTSDSIFPPVNLAIVSLFPNNNWIRIADKSIRTTICKKKLGMFIL